jgi:hypothetical protein
MAVHKDPPRRPGRSDTTQQYGPNSRQVEVFLEEIKRLTAHDWASAVTTLLEVDDISIEAARESCWKSLEAHRLESDRALKTAIAQARIAAGEFRPKPENLLYRAERHSPLKRS